jgi:hypothetical protein
MVPGWPIKGGQDVLAPQFTESVMLLKTVDFSKKAEPTLAVYEQKPRSR